MSGITKACNIPVITSRNDPTGHNHDYIRRNPSQREREYDVTSNDMKHGDIINGHSQDSLNASKSMKYNLPYMMCTNIISCLRKLYWN